MFYCFYKDATRRCARIFEFGDAVPVRHLYRRRRDVENTHSSKSGGKAGVYLCVFREVESH